MGSKKENLFMLLSRFKPEQNKNWKELLSSIGDIDDEVLRIIEEVKDSLLIGSAKGKDLDVLASNYNIYRPRGINMSDETFRKYIPIMAYAPKQILQTLNILLSIFYPSVITSAYIETSYFEKIFLKDGWTLEYLVDDSNTEIITFSLDFFNNINEATPEEIAMCITSQAKYSYAEVYENFLLNKKCLRIFSNTKGTSSSIKILSGLAINSLSFPNLTKTEQSIWDIEKKGINIVFTPQNSMVNLLSVKPKDIVLIYSDNFSLVGEVHNVTSKSFSIKSNEQLSVSSISTFLPNSFVSFYSQEEVRLSLFNKKVAVWETEPNKIEIEIPATTPVYREMRGSGHLQIVSSPIIDYKNNELHLKEHHKFPSKGIIRIIPKIKVFQVNEEGVSYFGSYNTQDIYYNGKHGNKLLNVQIPNSSFIKEEILFIKRENRKTIIAVKNNVFNVGDYIVVKNSDYISGTFKVDEINNNLIICNTGGLDIPVSTNGYIYKEISLVDLKESICVLVSSVKGSGLIGPFLFDENIPFLITSKTYKIKNKIVAGSYASALNIDSSDILEDCYIVIDYGKNNQEGPIRCYVMQGGVSQLDQSYIFKHNHDINSTFTVIKHCKIPPYGKELGLFATDPSISREEIKNAVKKIISAGITIEWLLQFRKLIYSYYNVDL